MYHLFYMVVHKVIWNETVHFIWLFAFSPTYSRAPLTDLQSRMVEVRLVHGIPILLTRTWVSVSFLMFLHSGMAIFWHSQVVLGLITGLWNGEEFPKLMNKPFLSTSISELWGKRYHQYNRVSDSFPCAASADCRLQDALLLWSKPFERFGRVTHLLSLFTISGIEHHLIYSLPVALSPSIFPWLLFFTGSGVGLILERAFYKYTGRRVGGIGGAIWTWVWMLAISGPITRWYWTVVMKTEIFSFSRVESAGAWALWYGGYLSHPTSGKI